MTTQECKCEDKNTDYHLRICCVETQQEQLEKVIRGCISKYNKEYSANYVLLPVERKRLVSAILSAMRIDRKEMFKIINQSDLFHLAKHYCEDRRKDLNDTFPYGVSHDAKTSLVEKIISHAQEIIKFEEE